jgi:hypothetical protein
VLGGAPDDDILQACRTALGPLKAPKALHRLTEWPMLASGKTDLAAVERALGWR